MKESLLRTPLGTDYLGRDVLSRLMHGARISLIVSLTGTLAAGAIGTFLGLVAGYLGGVWDQIIMRITDAWLTLPTLVFAILLSSIRGPGVENVIFILAVVFWSRYARLVRGEVLSLRERDFVRLAEVNGVSTCNIIRRHLLPNVLNTVMVFFTLIVGVAIIIEANLSFLGVGVPPPEPAWGLMISQERDALMEGKWWASDGTWSVHHAAGAVFEYAGRLAAGASRPPAPQPLVLRPGATHGSLPRQFGGGEHSLSWRMCAVLYQAL
jgi:peptide/nickel transport system permease protein